MRRYLISLFAVVAPVQAQTVQIAGPDTVTIQRGVRHVVEATAYDTRSRVVPRAFIRLEVRAALTVRGDTIIAGTPDSLHVVRAIWVRSDSLRPRDSIVVRVVAPAPMPTPPPEEPKTPVPDPEEPPPPDTVVAPPAPVPPVPSPVPGTNEPSGWRVLADRGFDSKATTDSDRGSSGSDGWDGIEYRYPMFSIQQRPSPNGDNLVGQMFYSATHSSGTAPGTAQTLNFPAPRPTQLYVRIDALLSANWVGNQSSTNKMFFIGVSGGNNQFFLSAEGAASNPLVPQLRLQGLLDTRARILPNVTGAKLTRGAWHRWEFLLTCNSAPGRADGRAVFWQDGVRVTEVHDINWTWSTYPTRPCDFTTFHWSPTYGGGGASPGVDQYLWFDHVRVTGR